MASGNAVRRNFVGMTRACASCGGTIEITAQMCKDGKYVCSPCQVARAAEYVQRNRDKKRAWNRAYASRTSNKRAERTRKYRATHPDRKAAHQAVQTAIRNGALVREACNVCSSLKTHAHHDDYSQPLTVIWLCHTHHMERHAMLAERDRTP